MTKVRVCSFGISLDGFGAGPNQSLKNPLGVNGPVLLGSGESLFGNMDLRALGYECQGSITGERATHMLIRKRA